MVRLKILIVLFIICGVTLINCTAIALKGKSPNLTSHSFEKVDSLMKTHKRPIAIFIHTNWCRYCKNMEKTSLGNKDVVNILNNYYYFISLDAESDRTIHFRGRSFEFEPHGKGVGLHSLAKELGTVNGLIAYPTFVILSPSYEIVFQHSSFINAKSMKAILSRRALNLERLNDAKKIKH